MTTISLFSTASVDLERPELDSDLLSTLWEQWTSLDNWERRLGNQITGTGGDFTKFVNYRVHEEFTADLISWCEDCERPVLDSEECINTVHGRYSERHVCDGCLDESYSCCGDCDRYVHDDNICYVGDDQHVCERCRGRNWSFCEDCDAWYRDEDADEHEHDRECGCESPAQHFTLANDGDVLHQDDRVKVSLPGGIIDDQGMRRIKWLFSDLQMFEAVRAVDKVGHTWQTKQGNFTKRLSRQVYKDTGVKLDAALVSTIGNYAREHCSTNNDFEVEITRDLNQTAYAFGHSGSCWWQSYAYSRCNLKSNGGFGLRTFNAYGDVTGRAWVMPLHRVGDGSDGLVSTFDTTTADAFVVFNTYGDLEGYTACRIVAQMTGMTYRKISFDVDRMYVNGESGYLVAPEDIAAPFTDGRLYLANDEHSGLYMREQHAAAVAAALAAAAEADTTPAIDSEEITRVA